MWPRCGQDFILPPSSFCLQPSPRGQLASAGPKASRTVKLNSPFPRKQLRHVRCTDPHCSWRCKPGVSRRCVKERVYRLTLKSWLALASPRAREVHREEHQARTNNEGNRFSHPGRLSVEPFRSSANCRESSFRNCCERHKSKWPNQSYHQLR